MLGIEEVIKLMTDKEREAIKQTKAPVDMVNRLERFGLVEWTRANTIRLSDLGKLVQAHLQRSTQ